MGIYIKDAKESDSLNLAKVRKQVWEETYRGIYSDEVLDNYNLDEYSNKFLKRINDNNLKLKVAVDCNNHIIGYICYGEVSKEEYYNDIKYAIVYIHILKIGQGLGLGRRFFNECYSYMKINDVKEFYVYCNKHNYNAHKYYEKMGGILSSYDDKEGVYYIFKVEK